MDEHKVLDQLRNKLGYSVKSTIKIRKYVDLLLKANKKYNLISKTTERIIWLRHILDSAQITKFLDKNQSTIIADFGSGAGLPGIIIALYNDKNRFHVKLYEKSPVKRTFLKKVINELNIHNVEIFGNIYSEKISTDIILCRAFKKLPEIMKISREIVKKPHKIVILKGRNADKEIKELSIEGNYSYRLEKSITDHDSKIILIEVE